MLKPHRRSPRAWLAVVACLVLIALLPTTAWAQANKGKKEPTPEELKGYTLPYFFTAVGVLAVTMTICWPANRKWEVALSDDDE